jgi:hypothetical protein
MRGTPTGPCCASAWDSLAVAGPPPGAGDQRLTRLPEKRTRCSAALRSPLPARLADCQQGPRCGIAGLSRPDPWPGEPSRCHALAPHHQGPRVGHLADLAKLACLGIRFSVGCALIIPMIIQTILPPAGWCSDAARRNFAANHERMTRPGDRSWAARCMRLRRQLHIERWDLPSTGLLCGAASGCGGGSDKRGWATCRCAYRVGWSGPSLGRDGAGGVLRPPIKPWTTPSTNGSEKPARNA